MGNQNEPASNPSCLLEPGLPESCENLDPTPLLNLAYQESEAVAENGDFRMLGDTLVNKE